MNAASPSPAATLPDYNGGSIANLMWSIAAAFGVPHAACPPLRSALSPPLERHSRVLLIVVDGLGHRYLTQASPAGTLKGHVRASLTSVFPSTTASAITTFLTGLSPAEHGLTGWHMYFEEIDAIGAVLPFRLRGSEEPLSKRGLHAPALFGHHAFFDRLPVSSETIGPQKIVHSDFNVAHSGRARRHGYTNLAQLFHIIEQCLRERGERKFVYAYWPELDSVAHEYGVGSRQAAESLRRFDEGFARLLSSLRGCDATVLVTGDHGLIDAPAQAQVQLEDHPRLAAMLARPLSGERRAAYCHVTPDRHADFERYVDDVLASRVERHESRTLVDRGWFGPGEPHPKLLSRLGDYVLVMRDRATIKDWMPGEKRYNQIGVHGGTTPEEMLVPLVVVEP